MIYVDCDLYYIRYDSNVTFDFSSSWCRCFISSSYRVHIVYVIPIYLLIIIYNYSRSMRSVRKTIRQLATSILGRLDGIVYISTSIQPNRIGLGWLADTVLSQFEEEARRYSQKATSWHNKIKKVLM